MECLENKEWADNPELKAVPDVKAQEAPQANQEDSSQFPDHRDLPEHPEPQENPVLRVNLDQTVNHSKDHLDCPVMQEAPERRVDQERLDQPAQVERQERRDLASTARHQELPQAIKLVSTLASIEHLRVDAQHFLYIPVALLLLPHIKSKT